LHAERCFTPCSHGPKCFGALFRFVPLFVNSSLHLSLTSTSLTFTTLILTCGRQIVVIPIASSARPRSESFVVDSLYKSSSAIPKYLTRSQSKTLRGEWAARTRTARPPRGGTTMRAARATARTGERAANGAGGTAVQRRSRARDRDPENPGGVSVAAAAAAAAAGAGAGGDRGGNTGDDTNAGAAVAAPAARATRATPRMPAGSWNFYERRRRTR
jgi:hypothetical protein